MRLLFEQVAVLPPEDRAASLRTAAADDDLRRSVRALLVMDARAGSVLQRLGAAPDEERTLSRWDRLRTLFDAASALDATARAALLDGLDEPDAGVRGRLDGLLRAYRDAPTLLDVPPPTTLPADPPADHPADARGVRPDARPRPAAPPRPAEGEDALVGTAVRHYRILDRVGRGGMGIVYRARDESLDRLVAIKFLPPALYADADADADARFVQEARAVSAIDHPNIATVHEIGRTGDGQRFIVMPFYDGETLREKIRRGPLPLDAVLDFGLQLARGLQRAHEHGIVHRDVKPENAIVTARGVLKILDFGLAKRQDVGLTATGVTMGTLAYMSPEQTYGGTVDRRTDVWAFGIVLFEMLTGRHPFAPGAAPAPTASGASVDAAARALRPEAPEALLWILGALLQKDPSQRPADLGAVAGDLEALRDAGPATSTMTTPLAVQLPPTGAFPVSPPPAVAPRTLPGTPRARLVVGGGLAVAALAVVLWMVAGRGDAAAVSAEARARARTFNDQALVYLSENQTALARASAERALEADSTYSGAWSTLSAARWRDGAYDEAVAAARTALRFDSLNSSAYYNLALPLEDTGRPDEAIRAYRDAIRMDTTFTRAYSALGNLLVAQGRTEEAIPLLRRGLRAAPDSTFLFLLYTNLGEAHLAEGDAASALPALERSRALEAGWPETFALLAEAYLALGDTARGQAAFQQYAVLEPDPARENAVLGRLGLQ